jgi:glucosamine-phosphate N-acetyltransferase
MPNQKTSVKVQEAKHGDLKGLLESLTNLTSLEGLTVSEAKDILDEIALNKGHKIFVAKNKKGMVIGTATVLLEPKMIHGGCVVAHIEDVAVRKGSEGKGVGSALMKQAVAYAKKRRCYRIILDCSEQNVGFYKKFGFKSHGIEMRLNLGRKI